MVVVTDCSVHDRWFGSARTATANEAGEMAKQWRRSDAGVDWHRQFHLAAHPSVMNMCAKVLCVDDERTTLLLNQAIFAEAGYRVRCANSGTEAVASLQREVADAVILDYAMPEMDGYATALEIRKLQPRIAIVVSTGSDRVPDDFRNIADGWHNKSDGPHALLLAVQNALTNIHQLRSYLFESRRVA